MEKNGQSQDTIIRMDKGLSIAGTRYTLYHVMDYLQDNWPSKLIKDWLNLTDEQINAAIAYIDSHKTEVEADYQEILQLAEESRQYWEDRNHAHFEKIAKLPPTAEKEALQAKLQAWKEKRNIQ